MAYTDTKDVLVMNHQQMEETVGVKWKLRGDFTFLRLAGNEETENELETSLSAGIFTGTSTSMHSLLTRSK